MVLTLIISSSPSCERGRSAERVALSLAEEGRKVAMILIQDGVYHGLKGKASKGLLRNVATRGLEMYVLQDDLRARGFQKKDLAEGASLVTYSEIVDIVMERSEKVIGAL